MGPTTPGFNYARHLETEQDRDDYACGAFATLQIALKHDEQDTQVGEKSYESMVRNGFCPAMIRDVAECIQGYSQLAATAIFDKLQQ